MTGKVVEFEIGELDGLLRSSRVLLFVALSVIFIATVKPVFFANLAEFDARVFYWGVSAGLYILLIPFWAWGVRQVWPRLFAFPIPLILATAPLVCALTLFSGYLPDLLPGWVPSNDGPASWQKCLRNVLIAHVIETVVLVRFLPLLRLQRMVQGGEIPVEVPAGEVEPVAVVLSGQSLPLAEIRSVRSDEHYLVLNMQGREERVRARMADFLAQVPEDSGVQTHRSHWVARGEVGVLGRDVLRTRSGEEIPVSRRRWNDIQAWRAQYLDQE
ncbi:MAG: LytTR family DNA-binding domain-containing protein [Paracoccaceae bacterium]